MAPPIFFIYGKNWFVVPYPFIFNDGGDLVIKNKRFAIDVGGEDGVGDFKVHIVNDDDTELVGGPSESTQGKVFADGVIFTVAIFSEKLSRCRPVIFCSPIYGINDVAVFVHSFVD